MIYELGKPARFTLVVRDPTTGAPTNATGVALTLTFSSGAPQTPTVQTGGTGSYYADAILSPAGDVRGVWTGNGGQVLDEFAYVIAPSGWSPAWAPDLDAVASHVPLRTIEADDYTGTLRKTFTGLTMPTASQVEQFIVEAIGTVTGQAGTIDATLGQYASSVAAMWAAAQVELAQPAESFDSRRYEELMRQFNASMALLVQRNEAVTDTSTSPDPDGSWYFGTPVPWGDVIL